MKILLMNNGKGWSKGQEHLKGLTVLSLLNDNEKRHAMGAAVYNLMKLKYSVQAMGETYLGFYWKLLSA